MPAEGEERGVLAVIETHPIQYRAPVYRSLHERFRIPLKVIYGSDFSISGYYDAEFRSEFAWDTDLVSGYPHVFLTRVAEGGGQTYSSVSARGMYRALRRVNPAAILLVGYSPRFHQWAWLRALTSGRPLLFRGETTERSQTKGALRLRVRTRLLRTFYRRCNKLLYIGQRSREHFSSYGCSDDKLIFSPYCVDLTAFEVDEEARLRLRETARASLGADRDTTVLLFSGKLSERKGPDLLIEAAGALGERERLRTVVVFLGNGELLPLLRETAARRGVSVRFLGFQNQKSISPWFHAADLLVLPSRSLETWGLVVNEALHHGLPCVVSEAVGCAPDLITSGVTGEVFETGSSSALHGAIIEALPLTGKAHVRDACRERVSGYSVDKAAEGIARAYEAAVA